MINPFELIIEDGVYEAQIGRLSVTDGPIKNIAWISEHPFLDENYSNDKSIPTMTNRGLFRGYAMDIWETPAKPFEELLFKMRVPHIWDGVTNPWFVAITTPSGDETINDKYQFQMEWQSGDIGAVLPDTVQETITYEVTLISGENVNGFAHIIAFETNAATIVRGQNIQWRLRRIAASASEVANEPIVYHWDTRWKISRLGTESIQGY